MIDHAFEYVAKCWPVFPCDPRNKAPHPILGRTGGFHHATLDYDQITDWWRRAPDALIGSAASFAVDIDTPEGVQAAAQLGLRAGVIVETGNGHHAHFAPIPRRRERGTVMGLTIRPVNKAYVILPPSRHPSGKVYRWVNVTEAPRLADLPPLPAAALDVIAPEMPPLGRAYTRPPAQLAEVTEGLRRHVDRILDTVRTSQPGTRHTAAVTAASHLARIEQERGLPPGTFRHDLEEAARAAGLDDLEVTGDGYRSGITTWAWGTAA